LNTFIKSHPTNARAFEIRGIFQLLQSKDTEAEQDFHKGLELDPKLKSEIDKITTEVKRPENLDKRSIGIFNGLPPHNNSFNRSAG
jgi:hypothetical protein